MKSDELMVLALAGAAVFLIVKSGGLLTSAKASPLPKQNTFGLIYTPDPFYGDTSKYEAYAPIAKANGGWGIE